MREGKSGETMSDVKRKEEEMEKENSAMKQSSAEMERERPRLVEETATMKRELDAALERNRQFCEIHGLTLIDITSFTLPGNPVTEISCGHRNRHNTPQQLVQPLGTLLSSIQK